MTLRAKLYELPFIDYVTIFDIINKYPDLYNIITDFLQSHSKIQYYFDQRMELQIEMTKLRDQRDELENEIENLQREKQDLTQGIIASYKKRIQELEKITVSK
jgi:uncharacterized coiled-coil DUF342 family protein